MLKIPDTINHSHNDIVFDVSSEADSPPEELFSIPLWLTLGKDMENTAEAFRGMRPFVNGLALVKERRQDIRRIGLAHPYGKVVSDTVEKLLLCTVEDRLSK